MAPGCSPENVAREDDHQLVAPEDRARAVDHADPVGVAVEGDAQVGAGFGHLPHQILQVLLPGRVGMVVGETAVHLAEHLGHVGSQPTV